MKIVEGSKSCAGESTAIERVCGNCQLTIKQHGNLICSPMGNGVFLKDGHSGWFAPIVQPDEEACLFRFIPREEEGADR